MAHNASEFDIEIAGQWVNLYTYRRVLTSSVSGWETLFELTERMIARLEEWEKSLFGDELERSLLRNFAPRADRAREHVAHNKVYLAPGSPPLLCS